MKIKSLIFLVIFFGIPLYGFKVKGPEIKRILIVYVPDYIETPYRITCGGFESSFSSRLERKVITNKKVLNSFRECLNSCVYSAKNKDIDVRIKAYVFLNNNKKTTICMDRFNEILLNGKLIKPDSCLQKLIRSVL